MKLIDRDTLVLLDTLFLETLYMKKYRLFLLFFFVCNTVLTCVADNKDESNQLVMEKQIVFYPGYGYLKGDYWHVTVRLWISEELDLIRRGALKGTRKIVQHAAEIESLTYEQKALFKSRAQAFLRDSESGEEVIIRFDKDPDQRDFIIVDKQGNSQTDRNGNIEGILRISVNKVKQLAGLQGSHNGKLSYHAVSKNHGGRGESFLTPSNGMSVISDIDDTIKITEIPSGNKVVLQNTFFKPFKATPGMLKMYQGFEKGTAFHYVSGGPWQLYDGLSKFLFEQQQRFPAGSMHMKNVRTNLSESNSFKDILKLIEGGATIEQKLEQISQIIHHFPKRQFILIGDSGEHDPEIFFRIKQKYPEQIKEIRIRDIVNDEKCHPKRLKGMTVIRVDLKPEQLCS